MSNNNRLDDIRNAERQSHEDVYSSHTLYEPGSWLAKPVKTVLDILPVLQHISSPRILDLGCGVGRNSIAIAQYFSDRCCHVDCVDILDYAIEKLKQYASSYGVSKSIHGIVSSIDDFKIPSGCYDMILAVSALEHVNCVQTFNEKLTQITNGLRPGGIACIIANSGVRELDSQSRTPLPPQFEVNLPTVTLKETLDSVFHNYSILKLSTSRQKYTVPRGKHMADIETDVVTLVALKP